MRSVTQAGGFAAALEKVVRFAAHPLHERLHLRMSQQRLRGRVFAGQLALAEQGMDLPVADAVQDDGLAPTLRARHQVVGVLLRHGHLAPAQRAHRQRRGRCARDALRQQFATDASSHGDGQVGGAGPQTKRAGR